MNETRTRDERTAVDKAIDVLKAFGRDAHLGIGVSELSRRAGLSKSTTFRVLGMLEHNGAVERAGTAYRLGRLIEELGTPAAAPMQDAVRDAVTPFLAELYVQTHATVQLAMLAGSHVVYLNKLEGPARLRTPSRIGGRMPAYCTGVGKVLLAADPIATEIALREPRHAWTAHTIVDEHAFLAELDHVRTSGVAHDRGESLETLSCIAAPVRGAGGRVIAALSVSGDAATFQPLRYERTLRAVAYSASRALATQKLAAERRTAAVA
ncbi:IclR family transcriptional regulator [Microbacterium fluvii]|uniref:IclR family transcriptional regulator n=1 Tax=Microbacterium fluvii TaxID=415215 RepID=A0ABW2HGH1_9MICO|nr:IclR family transcriptional regulator [Microbacterium fluvii]MCU4672721.1 IclR family transcriptional regulator [Microbacterium fluvii]